ncbi:EXS family-domain-containing protein [Phaeosphaeriaceae sp. PMI808]|nr:EXS family-domain-containing protein [Phaeosphaeriaceae sp. PMI808]
MGFWDQNEDNYKRVYENDQFEEHKSSFGHELIAGGAAFAGFKAFEDHQRAEGKPVSHAFAKELLAGFAGAEVDKLAETKGEDWFDREKAKREAKRHAEKMYDEHYIDNHGADQYDPNQYSQPQRFEQRGCDLTQSIPIGKLGIKSGVTVLLPLSVFHLTHPRHNHEVCKTGKKKLKAINRALRTVHQTPRFRKHGVNTFEPSPFDVAPKYSYINRNYNGREATVSSREPDDLRSLAITNSHNSLQERPSSSKRPVPATHSSRSPEEEPLTKGPEFRRRTTSYGSIVGSPPTDEVSKDRARPPPSLKLPGAALDPDNSSPQAGPSTASERKLKKVTLPPTTVPKTDNAFEIGKTRSPGKRNASLPVRYKSVFSPKRVNSDAGPITQTTPRPSVRRIFSMSNKTPPVSPGDVPLEAYRDLDLRQAEFFNFLDMELEKIETFYKQKEEEATQRLIILHEQLHMMRDRRIDEIIQRQTAKIKDKSKKYAAAHPAANGTTHSSSDENSNDIKTNRRSMDSSWLNPIDAALEAINAGKYGKSTKEITQLATPAALKPKDYLEGRSDFVRRPDLPDVPYQSAKRKLKTALQEYYRGLELLKSYSLLNRTAFRKINKKYDKTVNARPSSRYMTEKVNQAWFVNSDVVEGHIRTVEDLYARYFERGNHKIAVGKLRIKIARAGDYTDNTFRNGLLLAAGIILGVQGIVKADQIADLHNPSTDTLSINTSYLLQASLSEGSSVGGEDVYLYFPVMLISISVVLLFNPLRIFYFRTRMWLLYSLWRLLLAGVYPVEWRDFYLGDMFCSLTYTMGNIATFFCLYSHGWHDPGSCNSSHLRIIGFVTSLPAIWRALQCIRRYADTGNKFPHLLNCGKYFATIMFYATLSIYRMDQRPSTRATFITFATINSVYTSFWDIYYDWSLGDPHAKNRFLRKELGYKKIWWYYAAMVIDPILRFNWIMYTIIPLQLQHSAVTSFCVSLSEIFRRGMWSLFRVENEHCTNVGRFRASRDVPLPYDIPPSPAVEGSASQTHRGDRVDEEQPAAIHDQAPSTATTSGAQLGQQRTRSSTRFRRGGLQDDFRPSPLQRAITQVGDMLRDAHAQDFERKRKPELGRDPRSTKVEVEEDESDDESDDEQGEGDSDSNNNDDDGRGRWGEESALARIREDLEVGMSGGRGGDR